jgi:hypothetical protein
MFTERKEHTIACGALCGNTSCDLEAEGARGKPCFQSEKTRPAGESLGLANLNVGGLWAVGFCYFALGIDRVMLLPGV